MAIDTCVAGVGLSSSLLTSPGVACRFFALFFTLYADRSLRSKMGPSAAETGFLRIDDERLALAVFSSAGLFVHFHGLGEKLARGVRRGQPSLRSVPFETQPPPHALEWLRAPRVRACSRGAVSRHSRSSSCCVLISLRGGRARCLRGESSDGAVAHLLTGTPVSSIADARSDALPVR